MKVFDAKSIGELKKHMMQRVHEIVEATLEDEVMEVARDVMSRATEPAVYAKYNPKRYKRRRTDQGLEDPDNVVSELGGSRTDTRSRELTVWNMAKKNPFNSPNQVFSKDKETPESKGLLQRVIIKGWRKPPPQPEAYMLPRPFVKHANEMMETGDDRAKLEGAFYEGFSRRGLEPV